MKNKDVLAMEKAKIVEKMQQSWHREVYAS